jgi:hypothetical protein
MVVRAHGTTAMQPCVRQEQVREQEQALGGGKWAGQSAIKFA